MNYNEEIFENKLKEMNISEKYHDLLKREFFNEIVNSVSMSEEKSFYVEQDDASMKKVPENEFKCAVEAEKTKINAYMESKDRQSQNSRGTIFSPGNQDNINMGTLSVSIMLVTNEDKNYTAMSIFGWETMPSARHTDAIGITRGEHLGNHSQTAHGMVQFDYTIRRTAGTIVDVTSGYHEQSFAFNDVEASDDGYAIKFNLPEDSTETNGSLYTEWRYTSALGFVAYEGIVNDNSATFVNHFLAYAHQQISVGINTIDFSISFPTSFTINGLIFGWTYEQLNDEHEWYL